MKIPISLYLLIIIEVKIVILTDSINEIPKNIIKLK